MEWDDAGRPIDYMKSFISTKPHDRQTVLTPGTMLIEPIDWQPQFTMPR